MDKRILLAISFLSAPLPCAAADLSGTWVVSGMGTPTCTFTQSGDFFRGPCEGPAAKGEGFGETDGKTVNWTYLWAAKDDGHAGAFVFSGQVGPDGSMSGPVLNSNGTSGLFIAKRK